MPALVSEFGSWVVLVRDNMWIAYLGFGAFLVRWSASTKIAQYYHVTCPLLLRVYMSSYRSAWEIRLCQSQLGCAALAHLQHCSLRFGFFFFFFFLLQMHACNYIRYNFHLQNGIRVLGDLFVHK